MIAAAMEYSRLLWKTNGGVQMPVILNEAPCYIMEELMVAAYGKHLEGVNFDLIFLISLNNFFLFLPQNFVFCQCHKDFLRLLTAKLKVCTYFTGDVICHEGEVNDTMYFIHKGFVEVYTATDTEEIQVDELRALDCFGMVCI